MAGRVEQWQEKILHSGARMVLINDWLTNVCMYVMGFYLLQDGAHEILDKVRSCLFWEKERGKKNIWSTSLLSAHQKGRWSRNYQYQDPEQVLDRQVGIANPTWPWVMAKKSRTNIYLEKGWR